MLSGPPCAARVRDTLCPTYPRAVAMLRLRHCFAEQSSGSAQDDSALRMTASCYLLLSAVPLLLFLFRGQRSIYFQHAFRQLQANLFALEIHPDQIRFRVGYLVL